MSKTNPFGLSDKEFELICVNRTLIYAIYMMLKDNKEKKISLDRIDEKLDITIKTDSDNKTMTIKRKEQDMNAGFQTETNEDKIRESIEKATEKEKGEVPFDADNTEAEPKDEDSTAS